MINRAIISEEIETFCHIKGCLVVQERLSNSARNAPTMFPEIGIRTINASDHCP